jgi:hypothetical protein
VWWYHLQQAFFFEIATRFGGKADSTYTARLRLREGQGGQGGEWLKRGIGKKKGGKLHFEVQLLFTRFSFYFTKRWYLREESVSVPIHSC